MDLIGDASKQGRPIREAGERWDGEQIAAAVHQKQTASEGGNNEHRVNEVLMTLTFSSR